MASLDDQLLAGECIVYRTRPHWILFGGPLFLAIVGIAVGVALQLTAGDYWYAGAALIGVALPPRRPARHPVPQLRFRRYRQARAGADGHPPPPVARDPAEQDRGDRGGAGPVGAAAGLRQRHDHGHWRHPRVAPGIPRPLEFRRHVQSQIVELDERRGGNPPSPSAAGRQGARGAGLPLVRRADPRPGARLQALRPGGGGLRLSVLQLNTADRLTGCLLGQALGDALGFVVEARPPDVAEAYVRDWLLARRAGDRAHAGYPFGQYSDDTQLARELLISVREADGWNPRPSRRASPSCSGPRPTSAPVRARVARRGVFWQAELARVRNSAPLRRQWQRHAGRHLWGFSSPAIRPRSAPRPGSRAGITHLDPRCAAGAVAVAGAALLAAAPGPLDSRELLRRLSAWVAPEDASVARAVAGVEEWLPLTPGDAAARLRAEGLDPGHVSPWLGVSAFVTPSVAWSLYAFLRTPDDYWATVCTAIAVGGDTDTMAPSRARSRRPARSRRLPPDLLGRLTDRGRWGASELARLAADCARSRADLFTDPARVL